MIKNQRILSIDIMRGLTLFLMLFVNDLYVEGVPAWLTHRPADYDGMGLADWVFPGFLFMVGMAVPFAVQSRLRKGDNTKKLIFHILIRTLSLLIIGVLMLNVNRINPELTGIPKFLWAILIYICIFLIWNLYKNQKPLTTYVLKGVGIIGLVVLLIVFKAGTPENITWLKTSWWGILGLIGWGYLVTSLAYLFIKENIMGTALLWIFFVSLNVLSQLHLLDFMNPVKSIFGVVIAGNVPSIVIAGMFFSLILRKYKNDYQRFLLYSIALGSVVLILGFVLRQWFIISKILGTPSWAMFCNGISVFLFIVLFICIDMLGNKNWANIFKPAGQNSLTTYLAPNVLYYTIWFTGLPVLFYKSAEHSLFVILGSVVWAILMIGFAAFLSKVGVRLKL